MQAVIRISHEIRVDVSEREVRAINEAVDPDIEESVIERAREVLAEHEQGGWHDDHSRAVSTETDLMGFEE